MSQFVLPLSASAKKASFANWLNQNVVIADDYRDMLIRNEIRNLSNKADDFNVLIQITSEFVLENRENFQIPEGKSAEENEKEDDSLKTWLIDQWTSFQNNMSKQEAIVVENNHLFPRWLNQSIHFVKSVISDAINKVFRNTQLFAYQIPVVVQNTPIPFLNGISINAP
ncbi:MAG: hypothetical protein ACFCU6_06130 [Balneolaceae bacterium]